MGEEKEEWLLWTEVWIGVSWMFFINLCMHEYGMNMSMSMSMEFGWINTWMSIFRWAITLILNNIHEIKRNQKLNFTCRKCNAPKHWTDNLWMSILKASSRVLTRVCTKPIRGEGICHRVPLRLRFGVQLHLLRHFYLPLFPRLE